MWRKSSNCYDTRIVCFSGFYGQSVTSHLIENTSTPHIFVYSSILKFMHSFTHNSLPVSFHQMWILNRKRYPDRVLRNADDLYIEPHHFATIKRLPLFNFPTIWNQEGIEKFNPVLHRYLKNLKLQCLSNL